MRVSSSSVVLALFGLLVFTGVLGSGAPWLPAHAVLFSGAGLLMLVFPPQVSVPRSWWLLAAVFVIASLGAFLPATLIGIPSWRAGLESLGVATGSHVAIQAREAAESLGAFAMVLLTGLWLAGQRLEASQAMKAALGVNLAVALYAILSFVFRDSLAAGLSADYQMKTEHFGFFPNRNHNATFLAIGILSGLGYIAQTLRDRRPLGLFAAVPATGICLIAIFGWSVSRAGIVLVGGGVFVWLLILGRRYLGPHGIKALALGAMLVAGLFFVSESRMKERLQQTVSQLDPTADTALEGSATAKGARAVDFRLPTWQDTLGMIRQNPLTGVGAGQFRAVFPQYRDHTAVANHADMFHPESDWLWLTSECGVPAALALASLVILAAMYSLRQVRHGRARALRGACLVAALIVPFHGLFDVPGHRVALAWAAALLFCLSLPAPEEMRETPPSPRFAGLFRCGGLLVLAAGLWLAWAAWLGGPPPRLILAEATRTEVLRLVHEDERRRADAKRQGAPEYSPASEDDPLEQAFALIGRTLPLAPLDRRLYQLRGSLGLSFDDKNTQVDQAFAIERALDPSWVEAPLRQGNAWAQYDPACAGALWQEALERAGRLDARHPGGRSGREAVMERIRRTAQGKPELEAVVAGLNP